MSERDNLLIKVCFGYGFIFLLAVSQVGCAHPESHSVPTLIAKLNEDKDPSIRCTAAHTLGAIGPDAKAAIPVLIRRLKGDTEWYVRRASASALAEIGLKQNDVLSALKTALGDIDTSVQIAAAESLTALYPDNQEAIVTLTRLLKDRDDHTRSSAAYSLGFVNSTRINTAIPPLVMALNDSYEGVRVSAAQSLRLICEQSEIVVPVLIDRVTESSIDKDTLMQPPGGRLLR